MLLEFAVLDPRLTELPPLEGMTDEEEIKLLTGLLNRNPPRYRGAARGEGEGRSQARRRTPAQSRAGRAAARASRGVVVQTSGTAIGASTSGTASRGRVLLLRDEPEPATEQEENVPSEEVENQDVFGDADDDEEEVEKSPEIHEIADSEEREGGGHTTAGEFDDGLGGEGETEVSVQTGGKVAEAGSSRAVGEKEGVEVGGSSTVLMLENPTAEVQTPDVPRRRKRVRSVGSGRKLTLSAQIGRRVKRRGNVDLMAGVSAGDASGTEDELGPLDARRVGRGNLFGAGPPGQVGLTEDDFEKLDGLGWKKLVRRSELHHRKVCVVQLLLHLAF